MHVYDPSEDELEPTSKTLLVLLDTPRMSAVYYTRQGNMDRCEVCRMAEDVPEKSMDRGTKLTSPGPRGEPDAGESDGPDGLGERGLGAPAGWENREVDALDLDALTLSESARNDILSRLKRIEGQARGIRKMIEDGRSCDEVVIQVAALKAAVAQVGIAIAGSHLVDCVARDMGASPASRAALARFVKIFSKLS